MRVPRLLSRLRFIGDITLVELADAVRAANLVTHDASAFQHIQRHNYAAAPGEETRHRLAYTARGSCEQYDALALLRLAHDKPPLSVIASSCLVSRGLAISRPRRRASSTASATSSCVAATRPSI